MSRERKNYYRYAWQSVHKESNDCDFSKDLDFLIHDNLENTLKDYELFLVRSKCIDDEFADSEFAEIDSKGNLALNFDDTGFPVPKKYLKQYNKVREKKLT